MKKTLIFVAFAALAAGSNAILIDDFSQGPLTLTVDDMNPYVEGSRSGNMVGGLAFHFLATIANPDGNMARLRVNPGTGLQTVSNEDLVQTQALAGYGSDTLGFFGNDDLNLDLSGVDRFRIHFRSADLPLKIATAVYDAESNYSSLSIDTMVGAGSNFFVDINFSSFGGYDFSDLDVVAFLFESAPSGDYSITKIEAVPEPASLGALAIGAAALLRRRKK